MTQPVDTPDSPDPVRLARAHLSRVVEPGDTMLADEVGKHGWLTVADRLGAGRGPDRWVVRHRALTTPTVGLLQSAARLGIRVVIPGDPTWPIGVDALEDADLGIVACLWVRGRLPAAAPGGGVGRAVAVVGARACSPYGEHTAAEMAAGLAGDGWTVVSGAAFGIDAAAHRGALAVTDGVHPGRPGAGAESHTRAVSTIAVLASGVDRPYPAAHAGLLSRIVEVGGAVVSELPPGAAPQRWRFLQRNRVIAALSAATVVVEAASRSGASRTARAAAAMSRPVGAVPGRVNATASAGCHDLIREGVAVLVRDSADVIELASPLGEGLRAEREMVDGIDDAVEESARRVLACLTASAGLATHQVALHVGLDVGAVRAALLDLEAVGRVAFGAHGWRRLT